MPAALGAGTTGGREPTARGLRPALQSQESADPDDALMARAAAGEERAFRELVERWERPVFGFLYRMTGSVEEALDLRQETFLRVHLQAGRYRGAGLFRSWLFRIAGNLARSALRRRKVLSWIRFDPARHDRAAGGESVQETLERGERSRAVRAALARLPERQRAAVVLRQDEGLSYREIAAVLETTESAVESLLTRAIAALRRELAREE